MATKAEIKAKILSKLVKNQYKTLDWAGVVSSVGAADAAVKASIVEALKNGDYPRVGIILHKLVQARMQDNASSVADTYLADDTLSLAEISDILGL